MNLLNIYKSKDQEKDWQYLGTVQLIITLNNFENI